MSPRAIAGPRVADNRTIAERLEQVAALLEAQGANQYRVQAWRNGAATIRGLSSSAAALFEREGIEGLDRLPGIGPSLARAVAEIAERGTLATLERMRGEGDSLAEIASVPGIGHILAQRIHNILSIDTLEDLEVAAHDGRLKAVTGFGARRLAGVRDSLAARLSVRRRAHPAAVPLPDVSELLAVDLEYRSKAIGGELPLIAPRRFNPKREQWLPVFHTSRGGVHYTAMYSNTALAHRLDRTRDWVVVYIDGKDGEQQCAIVTDMHGALAGRRVVRGREHECAVHYGLERAGRRVALEPEGAATH